MDVVCSILEYRKDNPLSDFFFQFRSKEIFISHFLAAIGAVHCTCYFLKTVPSSTFCLDLTDPCSCQGYSVYNTVCPTALNTSYTSNVALFGKFTNTDPSGDISQVQIIIILVLFGILTLVLLSWVSLKYKYSRNVGQEVQTSLQVEMKLNRHRFKDIASNLLLKNSPQQQAILAVESLARGSTPEQGKLLSAILDILRSPHILGEVDVQKIIQNSSSDETTEKWLLSQLMNHDDFNMRRRGLSVAAGSGEGPSNRTTSSTLSSSRGEGSASLTGLLSKSSKRDILRSSRSSGIIGERIGSRRLSSFTLAPALHINDIASLLSDEDKSYMDSFALSWSFSIFDLKCVNPQASLAMYVFDKLDLINPLKVKRRQLQNILLYMEDTYSFENYDSCLGYGEENIGIVEGETSPSGENDSPALGMISEETNDSPVPVMGGKKKNEYHNNLHGADVMQCCLFLASKYEDLKHDFLSIDMFSLLFAAYAHDYNHPGLNTTYVISDWPSSVISTTFGTEVMNLRLDDTMRAITANYSYASVRHCTVSS